MIQSFDTEKIINDVLPSTLRVQNIVELINAWLVDYKKWNNEFNSYQYQTYRFESCLPQVMVMEYILNLEVSITGSIYILDGDENLDNYFYDDLEYNPNILYTYDDSEGIDPEYYLYDDGENIYFNFYCSIPIAYQNNTTIKNQITEIIESLKIAGFSWSFKFY